MPNNINLYTDGAALGNPGPGGYGLILEWAEKDYIKEFYEGFRLTTNNRMELLAVIVGLEKLKQEGMNVTVYSDSKYVVDAINQNWLNGWVKKRFNKVKNPDLWKRLLPLLNKHTVTFQWIKGHNNHPENERCDVLAVIGANLKEQHIDYFYEEIATKEDALF